MLPPDSLGTDAPLLAPHWARINAIPQREGIGFEPFGQFVNRLLKANCDVYWMKDSEMGAGAIWVPASRSARTVVEQAAKELGIAVHGVAKTPAGQALKLKPVRIALYDQYGGLVPSGWTRWLFEQYEFPFELVYPQTLDAGDLKSKFDVLVLVDGALRGGGTRSTGNTIPSESVPEEYRGSLGRISTEKTIPEIKKFLSAGGSVVTIGSSTSLAEYLGLPVKDYLTEKDSRGADQPLPREKFYVPGSLLKARIDNTNPIAYGMPDQADVFFDNSPVFRLDPDAGLKRTSSVAWFSGSNVLDSGWAWGQQYLDGGVAVAEAQVGEGKVMLLGPEVAFRAQPHGTFKLLFNSLYYGSATAAALK